MESYSPPEIRFWDDVKKTENCWLWMGNRLPKGYGRIAINSESVYTHRFSYELHHGPIPKGLHVLHRCDNPPCCNPDHLFLGTNADNVADRDAKGRQADQRGERHNRSRLTNGDVLDIRSWAAIGVLKIDLAKRYGVSRVHISRIVSRRSWGHIPAEDIC